VTGKDIDLKAPYIKVITLHSAKGLEFPFVVITGLQKGELPNIDPELPPDETINIINEQRRLFYVGCSRAMRALMVSAFHTSPSEFITNLSENHWQKINL
jgi:superfamily I DNA/RNA helicase